MPNPMFLQVMGITLAEYNTYSPAKKARIQNEAQKRIVEVHEKDIDSYNKLTADTVDMVYRNAEDKELSRMEDEENN